MLHQLLIIDDALEAEELRRWQDIALFGLEQSEALPPHDYEGSELLRRCREHVGDLRLIHVLRFAVRHGHSTEIHCDVGEYAALFYPFDCPGGPLLTHRRDVIQVRENRLVLLACSDVGHQQVVPPTGVRRSVVFKFRLEG